MNLDEVFTRCFLCPGLCISSCPIYSVTRDRSTAPNIIGRSGYYLLKYGDDELGKNLLSCTGCGECSSNCPIDNPLPRAIRLTRKYLFKYEYTGEIHITDLSEGDKDVFVYRPEKPGDNLIEMLSRKGYGVKWIDTSKIYVNYSYGVIEDINLEEPFISDEIEILEDYTKYLEYLKEVFDGIERVHNKAFTLHIPCRLSRYRDKVIKIAEKIAGKPNRVISTCSGGGWMFPENNPKYSLEILQERFRDYSGEIITLCIRSRELMRKAGLEAYTILDILEES